MPYLRYTAFECICIVPDGALMAVDLLAQEVHLVDGRGRLGERLEDVIVHLLHRIDLRPPENTCNKPSL